VFPHPLDEGRNLLWYLPEGDELVRARDPGILSSSNLKHRVQKRNHDRRFALKEDSNPSRELKLLITKLMPHMQYGECYPGYASLQSCPYSGSSEKSKTIALIV
jgi:hypothetical protein